MTARQHQGASCDPRFRPCPRCRPAARSGTPPGQVIITGDVINDPRLVDSENGPAAIMPVRLAAIGVGGTAMAS
jgi:hypothetical protein